VKSVLQFLTIFYKLSEKDVKVSFDLGESWRCSVPILVGHGSTGTSIPDSNPGDTIWLLLVVSVAEATEEAAATTPSGDHAHSDSFSAAKCSADPISDSSSASRC
jgi:hypothetical protein